MALFRCKVKKEPVLIYYGLIANMSAVSTYIRRGAAATTVGNYALFAGGYDSSYGTKMDYYDKSLVCSIATNMNCSRNYFAATTINNYALFVGGYNYYPPFPVNDYKNITDYYDKSLVRSVMVGALQPFNVAATTVGNYALFAGGSQNFHMTDSIITSNKVQSFDASLTYSLVVSDMIYKRVKPKATTVGNYALFGRGISGSSNYGTDYYDTSLTHGVTGNLFAYKNIETIAATTVGNYALFSGGGEKTFDVYDASLTYSTITAQYAFISEAMATTIGNYAIFKYSNGNYGYSCDTSLTFSTMPNTNITLKNLFAATTVGNYAIFGFNNIQAATYTIG